MIAKHPSPTLSDGSLVQNQIYINGQWKPSRTGKTFEVRDPATNAVITTCPESNVEDLEEAISAASKAFQTWKLRSGRERGRILRRWYELIIENKEDLAVLCTWENGKSRADSDGEVIFAASFVEWYSEEAARVYGDVIPHTNSACRTQVAKEAIGVCGLITPWNFPLGMITRKAAPALAAGLINIVTALDNAPALGLALCKSPIVKKISFTGSTRVGKVLAEQSGSTLKKLSLELAGNAPFIVFDDADLDVAVSCAITAKFKEGIYDAFSQELSEAVSRFVVGSGLDRKTTHGPLTNGMSKVQDHIKDATKKGAKLVRGGKTLPDLGPNFFEPTVLTNIDDTMQISREETFGPIAALFKFSTEDEAIKRANDCEVGLAGYVMTNSLSRANWVSERLETGMVAINTGTISDASAPFGDVKYSGIGREGSKYGIEEYLTMKTIVSAVLPPRAML
ncbi:hypothetical protein OHC33_010940 [Knufia fluminis]|uniref:Aldehyde dehydrogenase domain-containing protein n=1 Tax=Knufia fluminis TaxID=191047 RepID=A0AAN8EDN5_9EURO|nr:hypothetical protein OHC33_010940 [Knufia fluminis]